MPLFRFCFYLLTCVLAICFFPDSVLLLLLTLAVGGTRCATRLRKHFRAAGTAEASRRRPLPLAWRSGSPPPCSAECIRKADMKVLVWLLALALSPAGLAEVRIWAVGDSVRVNPVTGKLLEDRLDIHKDYPTGDYRSSNSIWNAASKTVSLKAARNEFVAFQLIIDAPQPLDGVDVAALELANSSGTRLAGRNVQLFKEWYVEVRRPSTWYEGTSLRPAWAPYALLPQRRARLNTGV